MGPERQQSKWGGGGGAGGWTLIQLPEPRRHEQEEEGGDQAMLKPRDRGKAAEPGCITAPKRAGPPLQHPHRIPGKKKSSSSSGGSALRLLHHLQVKLLQGQTVNGF